MSKQSLFKLGNIYGDMLNQVRVVEEKKLPSKVGPGGKSLNDKSAAKLQSGGPSEKGGFEPAEIDANELSKGELEDNLYGAKNLTIEDEDEESFGKINHDAINKFMSKSIFDKLYENVMQGEDLANDTSADELESLGIDDTDTPDADLGLDDDTVTITLSKDLAKQLHAVLMGVVGEDEVGDDFEDAGDDFEDAGDEVDFDLTTPEEDEEVSGGAKKLQGKNNRVGGAVDAKAGKTGDKVVKDCEEMGTPVSGAKKVNDGKSNKVQGQTKTGKVGSSAFAQ